MNCSVVAGHPLYSFAWVWHIHTITCAHHVCGASDKISMVVINGGTKCLRAASCSNVRRRQQGVCTHPQINVVHAPLLRSDLCSSFEYVEQLIAHLAASGWPSHPVHERKFCLLLSGGAID